MESKEWQQTVKDQTFIISTAPTLPHAFIQQAFSTSAMYWAKPVSSEHVQKLVDNSCTLGLYCLENTNDGKHQRTPIGMARMVTDYVTLAYLTDVYVQDEYQGLGLGKWMVRCCRAIAVDMPELRFMILLTGSEQAQNLYRRELGMKVMGSEEKLTAMGARRASLEEAAASPPS
ncbi:unnamed protein product [Periconia digitata]|uniref:N-acetyltransferase domain-containing protein n=1 Tax=Periconia digitata TaxID=1303443 RepID=A0A9W4UBN5_9PLEO|nr:unnamed protein product [Periconia digitata]